LSPPRALAQDSSQLRSYPAFKRRLSCSSASCTAACDEVCIAGALGSTLALADSSGALDTTYSYEPFGNTTISGSSGNPYQFTGRENDDTGLYYYRARYYSPTFQRFVSQDPIGIDGGSTDLYSYVGSQPSDLTDPTGTQAAAVAAGGVVIACSECVGAVAVGVAVGIGLGAAADYIFRASRGKSFIRAISGAGPHCGFSGLLKKANW
jgi:RHS repeat-associated protein